MFVKHSPVSFPSKFNNKVVSTASSSVCLLLTCISPLFRQFSPGHVRKLGLTRKARERRVCSALLTWNTWSFVDYVHQYRAFDRITGKFHYLFLSGSKGRWKPRRESTQTQGDGGIMSHILCENVVFFLQWSAHFLCLFPAEASV